MTSIEAINAIKFCIHILYHQPMSISGEQVLQDANTGHFYTNDVKVLLEVCLRELSNIPMDEEENLRLW